MDFWPQFPAVVTTSVPWIAFTNHSANPTFLHINTKIAGERIITPTTIIGAKTGDVFPPPFPLQFSFVNSIIVNFEQSMAGDPDAATPIIEVTIKTDLTSEFTAASPLTAGHFGADDAFEFRANLGAEASFYDYAPGRTTDADYGAKNSRLLTKQLFPLSRGRS
jgi:hypothetical protein